MALTDDMIEQAEQAIRTHGSPKLLEAYQEMMLCARQIQQADVDDYPERVAYWIERHETALAAFNAAMVALQQSQQQS